MMDRLRESKWVYGLMSVLLAFVFWLYVRTDQDPTGEMTLRNIPVQTSGANVLTQQGLTVSGLSAETVSLRVQAPASVQDALYQNREDISVTVDVSRCTEGENQLSYVINLPQSINRDAVTFLDQSPDTITVTVDTLYTSTLPVEFQLEGSVAEGYQTGVPAVSPETVVVSGSVDQVSQVARVVAILREEDLNAQFSGDLPLTLLDGSGKELTDLSVTLSAESAYVVLPVLREKTVDLTVSFIPGGGAFSDDPASAAAKMIFDKSLKD